MKYNPVLLVHGGAWAIPDDMVQAHLNGVRNATAAGWRVLESGGTALAVPDRSMVDGMLAIGKYAGVSAAPEGGAAFVAIQRLVADGSIKPHESVVLFNTGGALKYLDVIGKS